MSNADTSPPRRRIRPGNLERKLAAGFAMIAIAVSALLTVALYHIAVNWSRDALHQRLHDAVTLGATHLDGDAFNELTTADQESSVAFATAQQQLRTIRDACTDLRFVYTLRRAEDGKIRFIVDAEEDPEQVSHLADHYNDAGPMISANIDTIETTLIEQEFYTDKWGTWLTGYAPVTTSDPDRKVVLCMDIAASTILKHDREFLWAALSAFAISLPFSLIAGIVAGRRLARPVLALTHGAERVAAGDLDHVVESDNQDEIGDLADAFNSMTRQLSRSMNELKKSKTELIEHRDHLEELVAERTRSLSEANDKLNTDLESAAQVQQGFLPSHPPTFPGVRFAWNFAPCDELGGDMLNIQKLSPKHVGIWIADVCGHGVAAALVSVTLSRMLSAVETNEEDNPDGDATFPPLPEIAKVLNEQFSWDDDSMRYFTFLYGVLNVDTREFRYVSAGHPGPLLVHADDGAEFLPMAPPAIGIFSAPDFVEYKASLEAGDRIYLYTDGITETENDEKEQFGEMRMSHDLLGARSVPLDRSLERLMTSLDQWRGDEPPEDDISIVAFELS